MLKKIALSFKALIVSYISKGSSASSEQVVQAPSHIEKVKTYHETNYKSVDKALLHSKQQLRKIVASKSDYETTFTKMYTLLLGIWCEARLHKLVYEDGAFTEGERAQIYKCKQLEVKWKEALKISFKKHKNIPDHEEISLENVGFHAFSIYEQTSGWISEHYSNVFLLRNRIAHGQWVNPFVNVQPHEWVDSNSTKIAGDVAKLLSRENLQTISLKVELLKHVATAINNLAVDLEMHKGSDFDLRFAAVTKVNDRIKSSSYREFKEHLQQGYERHKPVED